MGTPIINQPQVAILALGAIRKVPSVIETIEGDFIGIRQKMFLSHSYDHRVIDGALGGKFVKRVAEYLESLNHKSLHYFLVNFLLVHLSWNSLTLILHLAFQHPF